MYLHPCTKPSRSTAAANLEAAMLHWNLDPAAIAERTRNIESPVPLGVEVIERVLYGLPVRRSSLRRICAALGLESICLGYDPKHFRAQLRIADRARRRREQRILARTMSSARATHPGPNHVVGPGPGRHRMSRATDQDKAYQDRATKISRLRDQDVPVREIAKIFNISRSRVYQILTQTQGGTA